MTRLAEAVGIERKREPAADVVAQGHRTQQRGTAALLALGHRERAGHHAATRMCERRGMKVCEGSGNGGW